MTRPAVDEDGDQNPAPRRSSDRRPRMRRRVRGEDKDVQVESVQVHLACYMGEKIDKVQVENVKDTSTNLKTAWAVG